MTDVWPRDHPIRVLIADDHALFRRGLRTVLELDGDIVVVDEADDGMAAVEKAEAWVPDVVLMDVRMPRCGGIEACAAIRERVPSARIVMLTMSDEESDLFEAVRAGANGYVLKDVPGDEIAATNFSHQYWTIAQMLAQHTVGGCNLRPGDLLGTGTVSGPGAGEAGAIIELSEGGRRPVLLPSTGETRTFLADGDAVVLRGHCERDGRARIGFGECRGTVLPVTGL